MVDTGSLNLVINQDIHRQLGLSAVKSYKAELADGSVQTYSLTEPVQIQWKDRIVACQALVIQEGSLRPAGSVEVPNTNDALLGIIPLGALDLIIDPVKQELVGAHGDKVLIMIK
jgi:hypothetical protein